MKSPQCHQFGSIRALLVNIVALPRPDEASARPARRRIG
jgi:hypothetical protein